MKVLITGGEGFIGSHVVEHFQGHAAMRVLDNLRTGFMRNLMGLPHEFIEASILDREAVRAALPGVDFVFIDESSDGHAHTLAALQTRNHAGAHKKPLALLDCRTRPT